MKHIYVLKHPIEQTVGYVGQTVDIRLRAMSHQRTPYTIYDTSRRAYWITSVLCATGVYPIIESIEQCEADCADDRERHWIQHYVAEGCLLANTTHNPKATKMTPSELVALADMRGNIVTKNPYRQVSDKPLKTTWNVFTPDVYEVFREMATTGFDKYQPPILRSSATLSAIDQLCLFTKIADGDAFFGVVWQLIAADVYNNEDDAPIRIDTDSITMQTGISADRIHKSFMGKKHLGINIMWTGELHIVVDKPMLDDSITKVYFGLPD